MDTGRPAGRGGKPGTGPSVGAEADHRSPPPAVVVHEAVRADGEADLRRPVASLASSGLAAGLAMGFSFFVPGLIRAHVPDVPWRPLLAALGYPVGFLLVILGRQQLFTQNTLTVVLPLLGRRDAATLGRVARVWGVVLAANLVGALAVASVAGQTTAFGPAVRGAFAEIGREAAAPGFGTTLLRAVFAGWLIALLVWLLPSAETARVWVIFVVAYVVALAGFPQIVTAAVAAFYLTTTGGAGWGMVLAGVLLPTLVGNVGGGVLLVAALNHAQVVAGRGHAR
ncbi:MAG: formate/nitrite transporter family protein [Chloroflexota bacterium]|nr:formate/nitrite transporter family protein [Chloroflexota bacterium]